MNNNSSLLQLKYKLTKRNQFVSFSIRTQKEDFFENLANFLMFRGILSIMNLTASIKSIQFFFINCIKYCQTPF